MRAHSRTASWDASEARAQLVLPSVTKSSSRGIAGPLRIDVHLAPEDPRRVDLERRRAVEAAPGHAATCSVQYLSATSTGLFEQTGEHYGEIRYELSAKDGSAA